MSRLTFALALACAALPLSQAAAQPAAIYNEAVTAPGRPEAMTAQDARRHPVATLAFFAIEPGDVVADIYASGGYFTELMARIVGPEGLVVATNPDGGYQGEMQASFEGVQERNPNVRLELGEFLAIPFPENSLDFVLLSQVYHDVYFESEEFGLQRDHPQLFLAAIYEALRPGGTVGVIDHVADPGGDVREVVGSIHRIDPVRLRADFEAAGFVFDGESDLLRNPEDDHDVNVFDPAVRGTTDQVLMSFRKPE